MKDSTIVSKRVRRSWNYQILKIEHKGRAAFHEGKPETANPYTTGYRNQNGPGGNLQRQRAQAWSRGWELEKKETEEAATDA